MSQEKKISKDGYALIAFLVFVGIAIFLTPKPEEKPQPDYAFDNMQVVK